MFRVPKCLCLIFFVRPWFCFLCLSSFTSTLTLPCSTLPSRPLFTPFSLHTHKRPSSPQPVLPSYLLSSQATVRLSFLILHLLNPLFVSRLTFSAPLFLTARLTLHYFSSCLFFFPPFYPSSFNTHQQLTAKPQHTNGNNQSRTLFVLLTAFVSLPDPVHFSLPLLPSTLFSFYLSTTHII